MAIAKNKTRKCQGKTSVKKGHHTLWKFPGKCDYESKILHSIYPGFTISEYSAMVRDLIQLIELLIRSHGFTVGSQKFGEIKNFTISLIEGRDPENPGWLATSDKHRVPTRLGKNINKLVIRFLVSKDKNPKMYQSILTLLNVSRKVKGLSDPNLNSVIEKPSKINEKLLVDFDTYVTNQLRAYKFEPRPINLSLVSPSIKKKGPNGIPKVESAYMEAVALRNHLLWRPFKNLCSYLGQEYLVDYLNVLTGATESGSPDDAGPTKLRLLVPIPDSGFKTRIVAISDFWTQLILEPVREHVIKVTDELYGPFNFRMNQDKGVTKMVELQQRCMANEVVGGHKLEISNLGFLDASTWTDRFHRDLQKITMKHLFSSATSEAWSQLVVHCEWYYKPYDRTIKYGQGQGMGTNGSFDIATLTDHLYINFIIDNDETLSALKSSGVPLYGKVGDDLFTYKYQLFLKAYEDINLPINISKSKVPCALGSVAEFCARTFINGEDVSRISPNIISKATDFKYLPTLIGLCHNRGISINASLFPSLSLTTKDGVRYLDKLQPWLLCLYVLNDTEENSDHENFNVEQMIEEGWFVNEQYKEFIYDRAARSRLLLGHSFVNLASYMQNLKGKIIDQVGGKKFYGSEITNYLYNSYNFYDLKCESTQYLLSEVFTEQDCLTPKQLIVLERFRTHHSLIRDDFYDVISSQPANMREIHDNIREVSRICHRSCYDGGALNYDSVKKNNILTSMTKTLERFDSSLKQLSLDEHMLKYVYTYIDMDQFPDEYEEFLPELIPSGK